MGSASAGKGVARRSAREREEEEEEGFLLPSLVLPSPPPPPLRRCCHRFLGLLCCCCCCCCCLLSFSPAHPPPGVACDAGGGKESKGCCCSRGRRGVGEHGRPCLGFAPPGSSSLGGTPPPRTSTVAGCARELPRGHVGRRREDVVLRHLVDMTITSARFARKAFGATVVSLGIVLVAHALAPR